MFFSRGKKKPAQQDQISYSGITVLYFGEPIYERIRVVLNCSERKLELFFHAESYILDFDRLTARCYPDLCASFLAQGRRRFGEYWAEEQPILENEQQQRSSSKEGKIRPREGISLLYKTKEDRVILILLVSDVFLEITHMMKAFQALLPETPYSRTEL